MSKPNKRERGMKEALYYKKTGEKQVQCILCPHFCFLKENEIGKCKIRKNVNGILYSLSYGKPIAIHVDPIEKKPLYHFLPGTMSFSIGMAGCNLRCLHCQNWEMSQKGPEDIPTVDVKAGKIMKEALKSDCPSISYTYSEPLVSYEYILEIAKLAKKEGVRNIIVSNGFINPEPLKELCRYIDGANIDLKSIKEGFYKDVCGARTQPILETLKILKQKKIWIEVTNLLIPTLNDRTNEIEELVYWIKENLGIDTPLHFSAFYPSYKLIKLPATSITILKKARNLALDAGLKYVYTGNFPDMEGSTTFCPKCKKAIIKRQGFNITENCIDKGKCQCGEKIAGIWN